MRYLIVLAITLGSLTSCNKEVEYRCYHAYPDVNGDPITTEPWYKDFESTDDMRSYVDDLNDNASKGSYYCQENN